MGSANLGGEFYIYTLSDKGQNRRYASPLPEQVVMNKGMPSEAIAGEFTSQDGSNNADEFETNPMFVKFLQWSVAKHIKACPEFIQEAKARGEGSLMVVDLRALPVAGEIEDEDLLGIVEVKEGEAGKFSAFARYKPLTAKGFTQLVPSLQAQYLQELTALASKKTS